MAVELHTSVIDIRTGESVRAADALARAEAALDKRLAAVEKTLAKNAAAKKKAAKASETAAEKVKLFIRQEELAAKVAREHGVSVAAARKVIRPFGKDMTAAAAAAGKYAKALDRAQKETRELAAEQRKASKQMGLGASIARNMTGSLLAVAGGAAAISAASRGISASVQAYNNLEDQLLGTKRLQALTREGGAE